MVTWALTMAWSRRGNLWAIRNLAGNLREFCTRKMPRMCQFLLRTFSKKKRMPHVTIPKKTARMEVQVKAPVPRIARVGQAYGSRSKVKKSKAQEV